MNIKIDKRFLIIIIGVLFIVGCAPTTFLVQKGESKAYYFGSERKDAYELLCESGDLRRILRDAGLEEDIKKELYEYVCVERLFDKVVSIYAFLSPEEKKALKSAFVRHDYIINTVRC